MLRVSLSRQLAPALGGGGLGCVRHISFAHKIKLGEKQADPVKRAKYQAKFQRATKTRLCEEFRTTGECVWGSRCLSAHSLGELQPPVYFDRAVELAKQDGAPWANHFHLLEAQIQATLSKKRGFKPILDTMRSINGCELGATLLVQYVPETLLKEQMVEKAYVQIKLPQLINTWFLTESQAWAVKQVVGARYKPSKDLFRLTRHNHRPYKEILDPECVYDDSIQQLYEIVQGVRTHFPLPYVDADNCPAVRSSTSFTPEYVFDYDRIEGNPQDEFVSPFEDDCNAIAVHASSQITPTYQFEMDHFAPRPVDVVHFEPEPVLTVSGGGSSKSKKKTAAEEE
ncbi:hypothetical protein BASA81_010267 [Batrachochytrium salamandrivorans]|nr:hypothetical protein BASA81_010267 [Batrachochytrium salamandrivorans]